jgi:hypothetical protein
MNHGVIMERSLNDPIGKGREGKGREVGNACMSSHWGDTRPVDNADAAPLTTASDAWAQSAEIGGRR